MLDLQNEGILQNSAESCNLCNMTTFQNPCCITTDTNINLSPLAFFIMKSRPMLFASQQRKEKRTEQKETA